MGSIVALEPPSEFTRHRRARLAGVHRALAATYSVPFYRTNPNPARVSVPRDLPDLTPDAPHDRSVLFEVGARLTLAGAGQ